MSHSNPYFSPGIYGEAISAAEYHADTLCPQPSLSSSIARLLCGSSPLHAWYAHPCLNLNYRPESAELLDIGSIAHALLLEGVDRAEVLEFPDWRTGASKEAREKARLDGKIPILRKHWGDVSKMIQTAVIQLKAHYLTIDARDSEQTLIWKEDDIWCRARLDNLFLEVNPRILDYKTTSATANPDVVSRTLFQNGYDIQAAWYRRGVKALTGIEPDFKFIYQETYPPYALSVIALGPDALMLAEKRVLFALETWKRCLDSGKWPGYPARTCEVTQAPKYLEDAWTWKELRV